MKPLRYILIILLVSCMHTSKHEKFGIYGISDIKKRKKGDIVEVRFYVHFSKTIDRYSLYYYVMIKDEWVRAGSYIDVIPNKQRRKSQRSVGVPFWLEKNPDEPVKIELWAFHEVTGIESEVVPISYVFE